MTTNVTVVNNALQKIGTRTTIASLAEQSNEAIQATSSIFRTRDELLRMAPWNCATNYAPLVYITSAPGTPENQTPSTGLWAKGQPPPGWAYEYQYPIDCLKVLYLIPQLSLGTTVPPITSAITGMVPSIWRRGAPVKFNVAVDQFIPLVSVSVVNGGTGYSVGDLITLASGQVAGQPPVGAPGVLYVATVTGTAITTAVVFPQIPTNEIGTSNGGSYLYIPSNINGATQASTTGSGTGAIFNLGFQSFKMDQRVIIAQQPSAICCYVRQVTDPNVMDPLFIDTWSSLLAASLAIALTGDKSLANMQIQLANNNIMEARKADGNEGLTVLDHTPDWIRARGIYFPLITGWNADAGFDWGNLLPSY